jgi:glycosyltransferase involved in cell wall biosynthesis
VNGKIRLAIVVTHPIQYYVPLYRALAQSGAFDVVVFYGSRIGLESFRDIEMGVEVKWKMDLLGGYRSVFLPAADHIKTVSFRSVNNPGVGVALAAFKPDVMLIHGYAVITVLKALAWARAKGVPAMMTSDSSTHVSSGRWRLHVKRIIVPFLFRQFSAFLTMSDKSENYLMALGVPRALMFRLPMLVDEVFWKVRENRAKERALIRGSLGIGEDELTVAYVGKLYSGKRVYDLIEALARIRSEAVVRPSLRLLVVGDGEQRGELERQAEAARVPANFVGFVNVDEVPGYYAAADILVHPAELEQYGMVALEAAIVGVPLIMSDRVGAVGPSSIARSGENTIVYPCGDVPALAESIRSLVDDPALRARMGKASLRISAEHDGKKSVAAVLTAARHALVRRTERSHGIQADVSKG